MYEWALPSHQSLIRKQQVQARTARARPAGFLLWSKVHIEQELERVVSVTSWFIHVIFYDAGLALLSAGD